MLYYFDIKENFMKIFALVLFSLLLAGCGGDNNTNEAAAQSAEKRSDDLATRSKDRANDAVAALAASADKTSQSIENETDNGSKETEGETEDTTSTDDEASDLADLE